MKLPELKRHFKNKYTIRIMAGVLVVALAGTGASARTVNAAKNDTAVESSESTEKEEKEDNAKAGESEKSDLLSDVLGDGVKIGEKEVGKEETVYVISDSTGAAKSIIVSDHLINRDGEAVLSDASTLTGITNVKGEETYTQNGRELIWAADGKDIYYQGTSAEQLPVTQKITYLLDGKEMTPEELAGKSGRVTIRFDYTNNEKVEATIDGKKEQICVPFMAVSGMVLDESFRNIEVTNGKVVADGNNSVVFGYALPGLSDSLDVDEEDFDGDVRIPEYFEVTADVENFSLDMAMTVVANATNFLDAEGEDGLSSVDEMLDTLTDATAQLADGSAELAEGTDTLKDAMGEFTDGVRTLKDGVSAYTDGASQLADGIAQLSGKTPELSTGVDTLNSSAATLYQGVSLLDNTLNAAFTDQEKENLQKQVNDTVAAQEQTIRDSAKSAVDAQAEAIKGQAEAAVDAQAEAIKGQAEAAVDAQAEAIKGQAEAAVDAQTEAIKGQAEAAVDAQAEAIKGQAEAAVDAQAETIRAQAKQTVDDAFAGGQYAAIEAQASEQVTASLTGQESVAAVTEGIKQTDAYYYMAQGIRAAALQAVIDQSGGTITNFNDAAAAFQAANGISVDDYAAAQASDATAQLSAGVMAQIASTAAPAMGKSVADTSLLVAETTAQDAAVSGAKAAAGMAAVTGAKAAAGTAAVGGAKEAAGTAAVTGAKAAAGMAAVTGAKAAAGTAAVSGAAEAAQTAAFEGAKNAAGTAAVSAAEQTKKTIAGSIEAQTESGYSLVTGMKALAEGTQSLHNAMPSLISGVNQLSDGSKTLVGNNAALNDGVKKLSDGAGDIADGVGQLSDGAHQLADGIVEFNEEGIEKILNAYNGDIEPLVERIQAVLDAGADYQTYTDLADGMDGSVRFVYKTAAVKAD